MQDVTNPVNLPSLLLFVWYLSFPWLYVILLHCSHVNWSTPSFSSTTYQNFPSISDLLSKVPMFQHHTKLYSKCSTLLVSSLNLSPLLLVKRTFFLLNVAFAKAVLDLILLVHLALFVIMLPKQLKYSTFSGFFWYIIICFEGGYLEILITVVVSTSVD